MPGYILHLTAARMFLDMQKDDAPIRCLPDRKNDFYIGNLLPDAVTDKTASHFRDPKYLDRMVIWPKPDRFRQKYNDRMEDAAYLGYYFHLYIDYRFFSEYLPDAVEFLDSRGKPTELRREVCSVRLKRSGERITLAEYLSEQYYYGDYTRMNTWLCQRYHLPEKLNVTRDPRIEETDYHGLDKVLKQLKDFRKVPAEAVRDVRVFDVEKLTAFLERVTGEAVMALHRDSTFQKHGEN